MQLTSFLLPALAVTGALAGPCRPAPFCLTDSMSTSIINGFMEILTDLDRSAANATAQTLIADDYQEESDSINSLAGFPLGSVTFDGKTSFVQGVINAPAIQGMSTLLSFHDCTHIAWHWLVTGLGSKAQEVKGTNLFTVNSAGQIENSQIEFNSIAWGADTGYTTIPPGGACPAA